MNNTQYTQGPQGIQGPPGPQGPIGPQGPRGERGPQGERGNDGFNGMRGQRGPVGPQGPQGAPGSQGIAGPIGPQGPRGEKGDRGQDGVNGVRGPMGPQGPKGQDGTVSFNDLTDAQRESLRGPQGIEGPRGLKGDRGEIGPRGEQGIQGEAGPQGPKGADGTVTFESLTPEQKASLKGDRGENGYEVNEEVLIDIDDKELRSGTYRTSNETHGEFPHAYKEGTPNDKSGILEVQKTNVGTVVQEWHSIGRGRYEYSGNGVYTRTYEGHNWTKWKKLLTRDNALIRKEEYIDNIEEFAPIGGGFGKFRDTTVKKPEGCKWGTAIYVSENDGNRTLSQAGNLLLMCNHGEDAGKMYSRYRHDHTWGEWKEIGQQAANVFNHPEGRVDDPDEMKVNGYTITDRRTENLPGDPQGDARNGILKFMVQNGPTVKGSRAATTTGIQIYTQTSTGESHTRNKINGQWGKWKRLLMDGDVPELPKDLMTHDKMRDYHDTHIKDVLAPKLWAMEALKEKADKKDLKWLEDNASISLESLEGGNSGKNGGFLKLGLYGIEWRNNQKAGSAGHSSAATVSFTKLQTVYTVQACITGTTTGTVTFRKRDGVTYEYWGSNGNVWFNTFAIGLAK